MLKSRNTQKTNPSRRACAIVVAATRLRLALFICLIFGWRSDQYETLKEQLVAV